MKHFAQALVWETLRSGTFASLAIMPLGFLFRYLGYRIGHYGPKFAGLFIEAPQPWHLFVQHLIIGWISTVPLLMILIWMRRPALWWLAGCAYGAAYYVIVNSFALPMYFGDPTPWQIGWDTIVPSLIGHIAFGLFIAIASRSFARRATRQSART
jgi:uncharacterized membrane protein YagU involved in acid resistance